MALADENKTGKEEIESRPSDANDDDQAVESKTEEKAAEDAEKEGAEDGGKNGKGDDPPEGTGESEEDYKLQPMFVCCCGASFQFLGQITSHKKKACQWIYVCPHCDRVYKDFDKMEVHKKAHVTTVKAEIRAQAIVTEPLKKDAAPGAEAQKPDSVAADGEKKAEATPVAQEPRNIPKVERNLPKKTLIIKPPPIIRPKGPSAGLLGNRPNFMPNQGMMNPGFQGGFNQMGMMNPQMGMMNPQMGMGNCGLMGMGMGNFGPNMCGPTMMGGMNNMGMNNMNMGMNMGNYGPNMGPNMMGGMNMGMNNMNMGMNMGNFGHNMGGSYGPMGGPMGMNQGSNMGSNVPVGNMGGGPNIPGGNMGGGSNMRGGHIGSGPNMAPSPKMLGPSKPYGTDVPKSDKRERELSPRGRRSPVRRSLSPIRRRESRSPPLRRESRPRDDYPTWRDSSRDRSRDSDLFYRDNDRPDRPDRPSPWAQRSMTREEFLSTSGTSKERDAFPKSDHRDHRDYRDDPFPKDRRDALRDFSPRDDPGPPGLGKYGISGGSYKRENSDPLSKHPAKMLRPF